VGRVGGRRCCGFGDVRTAFDHFVEFLYGPCEGHVRGSPRNLEWAYIFSCFKSRIGTRFRMQTDQISLSLSLSRFIPNPSLDSFPAAALSTKDTALSDAQRRASVLEKEVSKLREDVVKWRSDAAASQLALSQHAAAAPAQTRLQQQQSYVAPPQADSELQQQLSKVSLPSTL
jgi:hypothetical protein